MENRSRNQITILHTNDIHGRYKPFRVIRGSATSQTGDPGQKLHEFTREGVVGGFSRLAAAVNRIRSEKGPENVLLVDGGDTFADDLLGNLTEGEAVIRLMNQVGYQFMALGNHDFDYGVERTEQLQLIANFPMRAANVILKERGEPFLGDPTWVVQVGSTRVGFLALGYPNTHLTSSHKNIEPLEFRDGIGAVQMYLPSLREQSDLVVILSHLGTALDRQLAETIQDTDIIIGGHSHDAIESEKVGKVTIVQAVSDASTLGEVVVTLEDGRISEVQTKLHTLWQELYPEDEPTSRLVAELRAPYIDQLEEKIATASGPIGRNYRSESPFDKMVGQILCAHTGAEIAFLPGIGYGVTLLPGEFTREDLYTLLPHPATIVSLDLTGRQVVEILEQSATNQKPASPQKIVGGLVQTAGMRWTVDYRQPQGSRIQSVEIGGSPVDENRTYRVVTNSGMLNGLHRYHTFAQGKNIEKRDEKVVDVVEAALRALKTVHPPQTGEVQIIPAKE
jgi:5'-nucleotidase / UDP-sugar diphosphatase